MASGLVQFKVVCSHITTNEGMWVDFPMLIVGNYCWLMQCWYHKDSHLSFKLYVRSETKDLKAGIELIVLKKDEVISLVKWRTTTQTFTKCGHDIYMSRLTEAAELKEYLQDDYFRIICNLTILSGTIAFNHDVTIVGSTKEPMFYTANGPSSYLHDDLGKLLQNKERSDVAFEVNGEIFHAHRLILAARTHVFNDELFGGTNENNRKNIKINEMEPSVFKTMLHFIYTDKIPDLNEGCKDVNKENDQTALIQMFQHLLSAANRYMLERLKLICEDKLSKILTINTIATTLILAKKHNCSNLKARCLELLTIPQYFTKVALTDGYADLLLSCPTILKELRANFNNMSI